MLGVMILKVEHQNNQLNSSIFYNESNIISFRLLVMSKYLQVFLIFINIKESKDVRMFNEFHDCNFPLHLGED